MKRVLVIEDNADNMELITFILEANGFETLRAETGSMGLDMAFSADPDFVLLDIQLPDIMGTEVVREIRRREADGHLPIIAVTSYAMAGDRERLLASGCDGYIEKPIDPMKIIEQIRSVIGEA